MPSRAIKSGKHLHLHSGEAGPLRCNIGALQGVNPQRTSIGQQKVETRNPVPSFLG